MSRESQFALPEIPHQVISRILICSTCLLSLQPFNAVAQWIQTNGTQNELINCLSAKDSILFAGYSGAYRSTDGGVNWEQINNGFIFDGIHLVTVYAFAETDSLVFAGTSSGVYASSNNGTAWSSVGVLNDSDAASMYVRSLLVEGSKLFAGTANGLYLSTDNGASWTRRDSGITTVLGPKSIQSLLLAKGPRVVAGTWYGGVFVSTNDGVSWTHNTSDDGWPVVGLAVHDSSLFVGNLYGGVLSTTDWCATWARCDSGLTDTTVNHYVLNLSTLASYGSDLFVGTYSYGLYASGDLGKTWKPANLGLKLTLGNVMSVIVSGSYLFAGTDNGIWRRPMSEVITSMSAIQFGGPEQSFLEQNYPNPFNPTTTIKYRLSNRAIVRLVVYNTLGEHIRDLVNSVQEAGYHEVIFDGKGLPSGVYFYRMQAGMFSKTKKLLLLH